MAHVRECDTSLWLHNKLGTSNDLWIGGSICSQLNKDVLNNIKDCFLDLHPQVKLKLLLSFLHLPRRNVDDWKSELDDILELALVDGDQWISMLAELLKVYPSTGTICLNIEENSVIFNEVLSELKKQVRKHNSLGLMPLECLYLNKSALNAVVNHQAVPVKHFALKRKPKSATLRAELIQKASDSTNNTKKSISIPSMNSKSRGIYSKDIDRRPLKGIPSRSLNNSFGSPSQITRLGGSSLNGSPLNRSNSLLRSTPAGKKDGGIKLLDITEQPIGYGRDAKRRKKLPENESTPVTKEKETPPTTVSSATPEYAAGLLQGTKPLTAPTTLLVQQSPATQGPTYIPNTESNEECTAILASKSPFKSTQNNSQTSIIVNDTRTTSTDPSPKIIPAPTQYTLPGTFSDRINTTYKVTTVMEKPTNHEVVATRTIIHPIEMKTQLKPVSKTQPAQQDPPWTLSEEQLWEAQEMFKNTNRVTRPEKSLILGFIAGSREHPCPQLGQVINIPLSENQDNIQQDDGSYETMTVETLFQMNYDNGEWKKIQRYK